MQTFQINTKEKREATGDLFGIFFEDINHAADGGLYAELVQNRAFEFDPIDNKKYHALYAWMPCQLDEKNGQTDAADVSLTILTDSPYTKKNPHYLRITANSAAAGVKNLGFNSGIALESGETYHFSCYLRKIDESVTVKEKRCCWVASKCTISRVFTCVFFNSIDMGGLVVNDGMEFDVKTKEFCWN